MELFADVEADLRFLNSYDTVPSDFIGNRCAKSWHLCALR